MSEESQNGGKFDDVLGPQSRRSFLTKLVAAGFVVPAVVTFDESEAGAVPVRTTPAPVRPTVNSISPPGGSITGGTNIKVEGAGFVRGASVIIGQGQGPGGTVIEATNVKVHSSTKITAVTGAANKAGYYNTYVVTSGGTSPRSDSGTFRYYKKKPNTTTPAPTTTPTPTTSTPTPTTSTPTPTTSTPTPTTSTPTPTTSTPTPTTSTPTPTTSTPTPTTSTPTPTTTPSPTTTPPPT